jgi:hypothetical protein
MSTYQTEKKYHKTPIHECKGGFPAKPSGALTKVNDQGALFAK